MRLSHLLACLVVCASTMFVAQPVAAAYPDKPVQVVVGYGPGGANDQTARMYAELMGKELGKRFLVVNMPGAASANGLNAVVRAKPDGYTLLATCATISMLKTMGYSQYTYKDLEQIGALRMQTPIFSVNKDSSFKSMKDLLDASKKDPKKLTVVTAAPGGMWHMHLLNLVHKGFDVTIVPNTQGGGGINARLLGHHVDAAWCCPSEVLSQINSGIFRVLAIGDSERVPYLPDVPTLEECGLPYSGFPVHGIHAPKGIPAEVKKILVEATQKVANSPEWKKFCENTKTKLFVKNDKEFSEYLETELKEWSALAKQAGLAK